MFSDNLTQKIAEAAKKIMDEELKGNQKKIDKNHNNKIDAQDFAILRGQKKANEEVGMNEEDAYSKDRYAVKNGKATKDNPTHMGSPNYKDQPHHVWATSPEHAVKKYMKKEEVEQIDEMEIDEMDKSQTPPGRDGGYQFPPGPKVSKKVIKAINKDPAKHLSDLFAKEYSKKKVKEEVEQIEEGIEDRIEAARAKAKAAGKTIKDKAPAAKSNVRKVEGHAYGGAKQKDEPETDDDDTSMKSTKKGTFKRRYNTKTYSEMVAAYREDGLKAILFTEEPTNDEFTAEVKTAQAKSEGKGKKAEVAKAAVQSVKTEETHTKVEVLDFNDANGVKRSQIDLEEDAVRVMATTASGAAVRPKTPQERNAAAAAAKTARAAKPMDRYTAKPVTGAGSVGAGQRQAGKPVTHIAVREEAEEELDERSMTDAEMNKREKIVKSMKKGLSGFKQRYGDRAKEVMYATATKQAMKD